MSDPRTLPPSTALDRRNVATFGPGTLGRDMAYTLVSMYLGFYLTEVLDLPDATMWWTNAIMLGARLVDAFLDFVMGVVVDNTRSRWGRFKPWVLAGVVTNALLTIALFTPWGLAGAGYVAVFAVVYLLWGASWTVNDISYWSLVPALSRDQHVRERIGAVAKVYGTVGLFTVVIGVTYLGESQRVWQVAAIVLSLLMVALQCITVVGVVEPPDDTPRERTRLRDIATVVGRNDQLLWTALAMVIFFSGYQTTTSAGIYYFKYVYRDEAMYSVFGAVLGVANLVGYATFPAIVRRMPRRRLFALSVAVLVVGYGLFAIAPRNIVWLGGAGLLMFVSGAWILMLCMVHLADTVEYGEWKLGRRNVSLTFAVQPFIFKVASALSTAIVLATVVASGINRAATPDDVPASGLSLLKTAMLAVPVVMVVVAWLLHRRFFRIDEALYARIVAALAARREAR